MWCQKVLDERYLFWNAFIFIFLFWSLFALEHYHFETHLCFVKWFSRLCDFVIIDIICNEKDDIDYIIY